MANSLRRRICRESKSLTSAQGQEQPRTSEASLTTRNGRSQLVEILRRITMAVQVFPFVYTVLFIFLFTAYSLSSGVVLDLIDYAVFVSPIVVVAHLVYSKMLKLCKWHRIACALPLIPQAVDQLDVYVFHFGHNAFVIVACTIVVTMSLFLYCIYKVFFTDEGKIC